MGSVRVRARRGRAAGEGLLAGGRRVEGEGVSGPGWGCGCRAEERARAKTRRGKARDDGGREGRGATGRTKRGRTASEGLLRALQKGLDAAAADAPVFGAAQPAWKGTPWAGKKAGWLARADVRQDSQSSPGRQRGKAEGLGEGATAAHPAETPTTERVVCCAAARDVDATSSSSTRRTTATHTAAAAGHRQRALSCRPLASDLPSDRSSAVSKC